jgi:hypothetical protein
MEQSEVVRRVVGVLTQAGDWKARLEEDIDRKDVDKEVDEGIISQLLAGVMPDLSFPPGTTLAEAAPRISAAYSHGASTIVNAFTLAFLRLADAHDAEQPEVTSADVLRKLSLEADSYDR